MVYIKLNVIAQKSPRKRNPLGIWLDTGHLCKIQKTVWWGKFQAVAWWLSPAFNQSYSANLEGVSGKMWEKQSSGKWAPLKTRQVQSCYSDQCTKRNHACYIAGVIGARLHPWTAVQCENEKPFKGLSFQKSKQKYTREKLFCFSCTGA